MSLGGIRADLASHLQASSEEITDRWLEELEDRLAVSSPRLLPRDELRDHIPDLLVDIAQRLQLPDTDGRPVGTRDHLWLFVDLRRKQSYDVEEVLSEFEILSDIVFDEAISWLEENDCTVEEACTVLGELRRELSEIGEVTVDTFQEEYFREKRNLSESLAEYARTVEHEIRDTLHAAMVAVDALRREEPEDRESEYLEILDDRLGRIGDICSDVRELVVAEDSRTDSSRESLRDVIRCVLSQLNDPAEQAGVDIEVEEPLPEIYVDGSSLEMALANLVQNALKYADPDEEEQWVRISAREEARENGGPAWYVVVEDNGLGIPPEVGDQIFDRFVRAHTESTDGTGLGLSIAEQAMEQRGGGVFYESSEGEGSTFTLAISPRAAAEEWEASKVQR